MKDYIKKHWKLIVILIISAIFFILLTISKGDNKTGIITPSPTPTTRFEVLNIFPPPGNATMAIPNLAIQISFSKPIDLISTIVQIKPYENFDLSLSKDGMTLSIFPIQSWKYNTKYDLTITVKSKDSQELESPLLYTFTPKEVLESDLIENTY